MTYTIFGKESCNLAKVPQDIQNSSYLVGSVMDGSDDLDLSFDDI